MKSEKDILNLIAFCILMESGEGILDKSPDYILEKLRRYWNGRNNEWMWGLDEKNWQKLKEWTKKWQKRDIDKEVKAWEEQKQLRLQAEVEEEIRRRVEAEWEMRRKMEERAKREEAQSYPQEEPPY